MALHNSEDEFKLARLNKTVASGFQRFVFEMKDYFLKYI